MLTSTFCCFRGVSPGAERRLWAAGCLSWTDLRLRREPVFSAPAHARLVAQLPEAEAALQAGLADWFLNRLRGAARLRVVPDFHAHTGFLDIETTGLGAADPITTIALYRAGIARCFVRGQGLHHFLGHIEGLRLLVTYNGASFDLPRIRKEFGIDLAIPHLDLRPCLADLGLRGGQKACEAALRVQRRYTGIADGEAAVALWRRYEQTGEEAAIDALVRYNLQDALALEMLAIAACRRTMDGHPLPPLPARPVQPDIALLELRDLL